MVGPADDGALGHSRSCQRRGNGSGAPLRVRQHLPHASPAHRDICQFADSATELPLFAERGRRNRNVVPGGGGGTLKTARAAWIPRTPGFAAHGRCARAWRPFSRVGDCARNLRYIPVPTRFSPWGWAIRPREQAGHLAGQAGLTEGHPRIVGLSAETASRGTRQSSGLPDVASCHSLIPAADPSTKFRTIQLRSRHAPDVSREERGGGMDAIPVANYYRGNVDSIGLRQYGHAHGSLQVFRQR